MSSKTNSKMQILDCLSGEIIARGLTEADARAMIAKLGEGYIITEE